MNTQPTDPSLRHRRNHDPLTTYEASMYGLQQTHRYDAAETVSPNSAATPEVADG